MKAHGQRTRPVDTFTVMFDFTETTQSDFLNTHQVVSLEFNRYAAQHHNQQRKPMNASKHTSPQSARSSERTVRFDVVLRT